MRNNWFLCGLLLVSMMIPIGCGRSKGPQTAVVTGEVTLDETPLEEGVINFVPIDGMGAPSGGKIIEGRYKVQVPYGGKRVEIRSRKIVGQKVAYVGDPNSPKIDLFEELIPPKYNSKSELKADVSEGTNQADFPLESQKK